MEKGKVYLGGWLLGNDNYYSGVATIKIPELFDCIIRPVSLAVLIGNIPSVEWSSGREAARTEWNGGNVLPRIHSLALSFAFWFRMLSPLNSRMIA
jgi:hypothetical protein